MMKENSDFQIPESIADSCSPAELATHIGYLYEFGVNAGILHFLENRLSDSSREYCRYFRTCFREMFGKEPDDVENAIAGYLNATNTTLNRDQIRTSIRRYMLEGECMIRSFLKSKDVLEEKTENDNKRAARGRRMRDPSSFLATETSCQKKMDIVYCQLGLYQYVCDSLSPQLTSLYESGFLKAFPGVQDQTDYLPNRYLYNGKGGFFKADTLILFRCVKKHSNPVYYLFVSDESAYADLLYCESAAELYSLMAGKFLSPLIRRSHFRNTSITSTGHYDGIDLNQAMNQTTDKELLKAIQAGAYACSFLSILKQMDLLGYEKESKTFQNLKLLTICGKSPVDDGVINLSYPSMDTLQLFQKQYQEFDKQTIEERASTMYRGMRRYWKAVFTDIGTDSDGWHQSERILTDFHQTHTLRTEHGQAILKVLTDSRIKMAYLLGNPGIGKTYAFKRYLCGQADTIAFYVSPRITINLAFQKELAEEARQARNQTLIILTDSNHGLGGISVDGDPEAVQEAIRIGTMHGYDVRHSSEAEDRIKREMNTQYHIQSSSEMSVGRKEDQETVLGRLANMLSWLIEEKQKGQSAIISNICVILTTQACKRPISLQHWLYRGLTLESLNDAQQADLRSMKVRDFAKAYSRIVTMIDEVSGDSAGIAAARTFQSVFDRIRDYADHELSTCLLIADASMTDKATTAIYERGRVGSTMFIGTCPATPDQKVIVEYLNSGMESVIVNCNSFPASSLKLTAKTATSQTGKADIYGKMKEDCLAFIQTRKQIRMENGTLPEQCIIYVQDKRRLRDLDAALVQSKIKTVSFHAEIGKEQREAYLQEANTNQDVSVILMTSSAARGISFKRVTKILIAVPTFNTAANLMEIVQLVFRGRGDRIVDAYADKEMIFYIDLSHDPMEKKFASLYQTRDADKVYQQLIKTDAMTMELLLTACLETRIYGRDRVSGRIFTPLGRQNEGDYSASAQYDLRKNTEKLLWAQKDNQGVRELCKIANNFLELTFAYPENESDHSIIEQADTPNRLAQDYRPFFIYGGMIIFRVEQCGTSYTNCSVSVSESYLKALGRQLLSERSLSGTDKNMCREILEYLFNAVRFRDSFVMKEDGSDCYIAYPLMALGNPAFSNATEEWQQLCREISNGQMEVQDIVLLMKSIIDTLAPVRYFHPFDGSCGFRGIPYLVFQADDFEHMMKTRYVNSQLMVSNRTNFLSLIFSVKEEQQHQHTECET